MIHTPSLYPPEQLIGPDPDVLDALLLRRHRDRLPPRWRLGLRLADLDVHTGLVHLTAKGETQRRQTITLDLAGRLVEQARVRGAV